MIVLLAALLVLAWARRAGKVRELGLVRPPSWPRAIALGVVLGVALKLFMKAVVMPLLGAPPMNAAYQHLAGNAAALPGMLFIVIFAAGFGEELLWRGFLFERLGRLFGTSRWAKAAIVVLTSALFGLAHYADQGLPGVQQATVTGLVFGTLYATCGQLPMLMIAHAAFDVTAIGIIYWRLETAVAHWLFK